jgi:hypothetical protein
MAQDTEHSTNQSLEGLAHLVKVMSPLEAMGDQRRLARSVADWILETVAVGCRIHLREGDRLEVIADVGNVAPPDDELVIEVVSSGVSRVVPAAAGGPTWVVLPIAAGDSTLGALELAIDEPPDGIDGGQLRDLRRVAGGLASAITESAAHERANQISQALQKSLLPTDLAVGDWFDLAARYVPGTADLRIGGDWYDSQIMVDGTVALSVGDVAGHGVEAAAQMGELRSAMAALRLVRSAPDDLISVVHRLTAEMGYLATVICVRLDPTGNLVWASAGHLPPLVIHQGGRSELLDTDQSPPLGAGYTRPVPINRFRLSPGDTVLLYTDGLIERRDVPLDTTLDMLVDRIAEETWSSTAELVDHIIRGRDQTHYTGDDIAVLAARWKEQSFSGRRRRDRVTG